MAARDDAMVSCLMMTLPVPQRFRLLQRSVDSYCRQTHANKELIIVTDAGATAHKAAIADYVSSLGRSDIRLVDCPTKLPLGALRNPPPDVSFQRAIIQMRRTIAMAPSDAARRRAPC